jgi:hydrogenase expression/formation protein HypE
MSEQAGKFSANTLKKTVLHQLGAQRKEVLTKAAYGTDTAVIQLTDELAMAVSSDPISLIPNLGLWESAMLSVHLTANDVATTGFAAQYAQFVLNLPLHITDEQFSEFWGHVHTICASLGVAITGGHTGKIPGQESTVPGSATMFVTAPKNELLIAQGARPGNSLVMTKAAAISSTSILAKSFPKTLRELLGDVAYEKAVENFTKVSATKDALVASKTLRNNEELFAMHDVTEGGVLGAAMEMAMASNCGLHLYSDAILIGDEQRKIAEYFNLDYRRIIGSGSMLMAVEPSAVDRLIAALQKEGIPAAAIGTFTATPEKFYLQEKATKTKLEQEAQDPYWGAFFAAHEKGLK